MGDDFSPARRRLVGGLLALPLVAAVPGNAGAAAERGIVGRQAPELEVDFWIDGQGKPTTFSMLAQRGKWVHLKCWQAWCPGCHKHGFPALKKMTDAFAGDERYVPVGLQTTFEGRWVNTRDKVRDMQLRYELPVVMGHDDGGDDEYPRTMRSYRTGGTPWHVLIDPHGTVIYDGFNLDADKAVAYLRQQLKDSA